MAGVRDDYDVVVIGAGIGGLACGALLARYRMSVLVAEQGYKTGGCCTSFEHRGYFYDNGFTFLRGCEPGGVIYQTLEELGLGGGIKFVKLEPAIRIIGSDYEVKITTPESLEDKLVELFPMQSSAIRKFVNECRAIATEMEALSTVSFDLMNIWEKILFYITFLFKYGGMKRFRGKSSEEVIKRFFRESKTEEDPLDIQKLRAILLSATPYFNPGTMASIPMMLLGMGEGCYYPVGGARALADLLAEGIRKYDGDLALDTMVDKILIENKRAVGVVLSGGRQVRSRYVVSNADAKQTFLKLVGEESLTPKFRRDLEKSRLSDSAFIVSLGVKLNLRAMGFDGAIIVYNPSDDPDELFSNDPDKCRVSIAMHSITDPNQTKGSTTAVQLIAMLPYDAVEDWEAEQDAVADKLIAQAEKIIPRLSENVTCKHITTPLILEQTTLNSQGACLGWYPAPDSKIRRQKTPIKNLYQAGHWTFPGGGVPAVFTSGRKAARLVLGGNKV